MEYKEYEDIKVSFEVALTLLSEDQMYERSVLIMQFGSASSLHIRGQQLLFDWGIENKQILQVCMIGKFEVMSFR